MAAILPRGTLLDDRSLTGAAFCRAHAVMVDEWLADLFAEATKDGPNGGLALMAVGGFGRAELSPQSDLDLLMVHGDKVPVAEVAERVWYPIWDSGMKLGHSVRTQREALSLAAQDLDTATALLDVRHIAGDPDRTAELAAAARFQWRRKGQRWLDTLARSVDRRHAEAGDVAFALDPDLKEGRGGLRDVHALRWAALADPNGPAAEPGILESLTGPYEDLLAVRVELHRVTGRPGDRLVLEQQDEVAERLGDADADVLMARVAAAGRTIAWASDETWNRTKWGLTGSFFAKLRRDRTLTPGIVLHNGLVALAASADVRSDPLAVLRVAEAAAEADARIAAETLDRLAGAPPLPEPWPDEARDLFAQLLLHGHQAIPVIETLDQVGLFTAVVPEWAPVRSRPQRNAYHRFTVDRHLCEAAANAAGRADDVSRPDLLVVGTLFHDIGKGYPGDHTVVGIDVVRRIAARMGYREQETETLVAMVEHHLLLPDVATRRDLSDDRTIERVAAAVETIERLELLAALTEADSLATGPSAWGSWKAELVGLLVKRTRHVLHGGDISELSETSFPTAEQISLMAAGVTDVRGVGDRVEVVTKDRVALFSRVAGALALNGLDVLEATAASHDGMAVEAFRLQPPRGRPIDWARVTADIERSLAGRLAVQSRLAERARTYRRRGPRSARPLPTAVRFDNDASADATVIEVVAPDGLGLLYRLTLTLAQLDVDIRSAKILTLGADVVDSFYVTDAGGKKVDDPAHQDEIRRALLHALAAQAV